MCRRTLVLLSILALALGGCAAVAQEAGESDASDPAPSHPVYFVLLHAPGPHWKDGIGFQEQPGVMEHVQYMAGLLERGVIVMGGPFLDDSGGMMIARLPSQEEALRVANEDPAVQSGLLVVSVHPWMVAMASVE